MWSCWPPTILQDGRRPLWDTPAPRAPLKDPVLASRVIEPRFFLIFLLTVLPGKEESEEEVMRGGSHLSTRTAWRHSGAAWLSCWAGPAGPPSPGSPPPGHGHCQSPGGADTASNRHTLEPSTCRFPHHPQPIFRLSSNHPPTQLVYLPG